MDNKYEIYNIESGDTLYSISKRFNVNPELLALINGLNINDYIYDKQQILVPRKEYSYYLTKTGDDLMTVLDLFNTDYNSFLTYNKSILLDDGQIFAYKR